ncbi:hypothetical protein Tco_0976534 [Tanacetum coccineum]|uniref:Transmembrane protein n=1 Tax=Tanacetum coccineum TaxID=301880 RepID=A0ABQ5EHZ1_9ASTR
MRFRGFTGYAQLFGPLPLSGEAIPLSHPCLPLLLLVMCDGHMGITPVRQPETEWEVPKPCSPADNLNSMEDDTILGGFHEETHVGPDDAPTTTADAAGRAEDPALLTSLSAKLDRSWSERLTIEVSTIDGDTLHRRGSYCSSEDIEEREEEEVPLGFLAEDAQARLRSKKNRQGARLDTDWLTLDDASRYKSALARDVIGADVNEDNFIERCLALRNGRREPGRVTAIGALKGLPLKAIRLLTIMMRTWSKNSFHPAGLISYVGSAGFLILLVVHLDYWYCFNVPTSADGFSASHRGIHTFFLDSDEDEQIGLSRVATEPDSDDEVLAEILFRGQYVSGAGVVVVDKLPDDEIVDPRVKVDPFLPVDDFLSSESESDDDIEDYIPPIPYGAFKDWEISLHSDDVEDFWRTQDEWVVSGWRLYPKSSVHVLDLTHGKTVYMFVDKVYPIRAPLLERMLHPRLTVPPSTGRDVGVAGRVAKNLSASLTMFLETKSGLSNEGRTLGKDLFKISVLPDLLNSIDSLTGDFWCIPFRLTMFHVQRVDMVINPPWNLPFLGAKGLTSPEQTATGKGISNPLMAVMVCPKPYGIQLTNVSSTEIWKLLLRDVAVSFDSAVHRDHADSLDAVVPSLVSAACFIPADSLNSIPADYVSAGLVLVPADSDRIC